MVGTKTNKDEVEFVTKRVETTKKEIDQLKADLQRLISTGINHASNRCTSNCNEALIENETRVQEPVKAPKTSVLDVRFTAEQKIARKSVKIPQKQLKSKSYDEKPISPQKVSNFYREKAREYIKKQRERRKEQAKNQATDSRNAVDNKKQKLNELRQKSLQILHKNIEHQRKRSRSRENSEHINDINTYSAEENLKRVPRIDNVTVRKHSNVPKAVLALKKISHITVRPKESPVVDEFPPRDLNRAATVIQSHYRGYRQRKIYKVLMLRRRLEREARKIEQLKPKTATSETQTNLTEFKSKEIPSWLQSTVVASDPYSFINTVKRKLQLVVSAETPETPKTKSDVAVQSSLKELSAKGSNDLKSFLSHKCLEIPIVDRVSVKKVAESIHVAVNGNSKSLKSSSSSKNVLTCDSDTSKNIPNITSEGSEVSVSNRAKSTSVETILSRQVHTDSELRSDSDFSDYKLDVNTEKLQTLKLKRRSQNLDDTMALLQVNKNVNTSKGSLKSSLEHQLAAKSADNLLSSGKFSHSSRGKSKLSPVSEKIMVASKSLESLDKPKDQLRTSKGFPAFSKSDIISSNVSKYDKTPNTSSEDGKSSGNEKSLPKTTSKNDSKSSLTPTEAKNSSKHPPKLKKGLESFQNYMQDLNELPQKSLDETSATIKTDEKYSSNFTYTSTTQSSVVSLQKPSVSLQKPQANTTIVLNENPTEIKSNQIHLKIEAELHLLNDVNNSLGRFMALEKSILELQQKQERNGSAVVRNRDTQTSIVTKSPSKISAVIDEGDYNSREVAKVQLRHLNFSRGSDVTEDLSLLSLDQLDATDVEVATDLRSLDESSVVNDESLVEKQSVRTHYGLSLGMFEQLIKDEDTRIQNLKTILKIREKALLDRTKGELTWLEIQKKHLKETGQLHEVSLVKKKQRGILMRLQHEQHEMQKLKHMQKNASKERKTLLKEQRNMIKAQLSTNSMLTKVKVTRDGSQRAQGPFKAYNISRSESIRSETSISRRSVTEDGVSVVSSHTRSVESRVSEVEVGRKRNAEVKTGNKVEQVKRTLLMREIALQKRRKAAEELLQWHQKLLEEEKRVAELETIANSIITEVAKGANSNRSTNNAGEHVFNGGQLNVLWRNMTGRDDKKFDELETYTLSQIALQHFCKDAKKFVGKCKDAKYNDGYDNVPTESSVISSVKLNEINRNNNSKVGDTSEVLTDFDKSGDASRIYTSDFENPSTLNNTDESVGKTSNDKISSITELIDNLTKINDEISMLSKRSSLNKSIDSELDNLSESKNVSSNLDARSKGNKIEINKLLVLKENLNLDNSNAILDSIQTLKSTIQKITSNADRKSSHRSNVTNHSKSTDKDISELSSKNSSEHTNVEKDESVSDSVSTVKESLVSKPVESVEEIVSKDESKTDVIKSLRVSEASVNRNDSESTVKTSPPQISEEETSSIHNDSETDVNTSPMKVSEGKASPIKSEMESACKTEVKTSRLPISDEEIPSSIENGYESDTKTSSVKEYAPETEVEEQSESEKSSLFVENQEITARSTEKVVEQTNERVISTNEDENVIKQDALLNSQEIQTEERVKVIESEERTPPKADASLDEINSSELSRDLPPSDGKSDEALEIPSEKSATERESQGTTTDVAKTNISEEETGTRTAENAKTLLDLSYGIIVRKNKTPVSETSEITEEIDEKLDDETVSEDVYIDDDLSLDNSESVKTPRKETETVDVKKRVSEIMADANANKNETSPRVQDLYVTTYDVVSPESSPRSCSPNEATDVPASCNIGNEAEELPKKLLAIEQEIKQLQQQQKEHIPYIYMREIPNKPPPPYTPPVSTPTPTPAVSSVLPPNSDQVHLTTSTITPVLFNAHKNNTLEGAKLPTNVIDSLVKHNVDRSCVRFLFDVCKELAIEYYAQFKEESEPSWMQLTKKPRLCVNRLTDQRGLEAYLNRKVKQLVGLEKVEVRESSVIKWSRKKRDHVDEILVVESQAEESDWTNYDRDELFVKNEVTSELLNMLLVETAEVFSKVLKKKTALC